MKDANQIAAENERREHLRREIADENERLAYANFRQAPPKGTVTVYDSTRALHDGTAANFEAHHVRLDLDKPGLLLAYFEDGSVEMIVLKPGMYISFEPEPDAR